jgi:predicted TIM-barrel fold metal-dependent hydrolase
MNFGGHVTIDVWMQHPTPKFLKNPIFDSLRKWIKQIPEHGIPIEATIKTMDDGGIEKALISSWHGPTGELISNSEVFDWIQQYPDRLHGLASVDLTYPMKAIDSLNKSINDYGFKGLRIVQWLWDKPCSHPLYYPLFAECVRLDIPVCLQVGLTGPLCSSETGRPLHIERIALDFPDLKIVCGHIGYPWQQEMIAIATKFTNVYIDTSAYKSKRYPIELVSYIKSNGKQKVMFGTNYPMITPKDCLEEIESLEIPDPILEQFLSSNAKSVFKL